MLHNWLLDWNCINLPCARKCKSLLLWSIKWKGLNLKFIQWKLFFLIGLIGLLIFPFVHCTKQNLCRSVRVSRVLSSLPNYFWLICDWLQRDSEENAKCSQDSHLSLNGKWCGKCFIWVQILFCRNLIWKSWFELVIEPDLQESSAPTLPLHTECTRIMVHVLGAQAHYSSGSWAGWVMVISPLNWESPPTGLTLKMKEQITSISTPQCPLKLN